MLDDAGEVDHQVLWGPQVDQLLADENAAGDVLWALTDHQNTVRDYAQFDDLLDETSIVNHIAYDAVGKVVSFCFKAAFRLRFPGFRELLRPSCLSPKSENVAHEFGLETDSRSPDD